MVIQTKRRKIVRPCQKRFYDEYAKVRGIIYCASFAKDGALFKRLESLYGEESVNKMIDFYLRWDNDFVRSAGYSVGVLWTTTNQLLDLCDIHATRHYEKPIRTGNFKEYKKDKGLVPVKEILKSVMGGNVEQK
jgi:hypothetical protein